jgi:hypothetical protein
MLRNLARVISEHVVKAGFDLEDAGFLLGELKRYSKLLEGVE